MTENRLTDADLAFLAAAGRCGSDPAHMPVWVTVNNAYFRHKFVDYMESCGGNFSLSVTDPHVKANIFDGIDRNAVWMPEAARDGKVVWQVS